MKLAAFSRLTRDQARKHDLHLWRYSDWRHRGAIISSYLRKITRNFYTSVTCDHLMSVIKPQCQRYIIAKVVQLQPYTTARTLAKLCCKALSTKLSWEILSNLKTKRLYKVINFRMSWDSRINMSQFPEHVSEIFTWKNNFKTFNFRKLLSHTNF